MSPIMIRPVKEQIEHDRVIRTLDHLFRRKYFAVDANVGDDKKASFKAGLHTHYPDLILTAPGAPKKILTVIEVESGESVNRMEAMAEWSHFSRLRAPFQLYIPAPSIDMARRIIEDHQLSVTELWSYVSVGDDIHFHLVSHASKTFAGEVQPGDTLPAMPVYVPPPPPVPPPAVVVVEKAPKAEKTEKAEKPEKAPKVKPVEVKDDVAAMPAPVAAPKASTAVKAEPKAAAKAPVAPKPAAKAPVAAKPAAAKTVPAKAAKAAPAKAAKAAPAKAAKPVAPAKPAPKPAKTAAKATRPAAKAAKAAKPRAAVKKTAKLVKQATTKGKVGAKKATAPSRVQKHK